MQLFVFSSQRQKQEQKVISSLVEYANCFDIFTRENLNQKVSACSYLTVHLTIITVTFSMRYIILNTVHRGFLWGFILSSIAIGGCCVLYVTASVFKHLHPCEFV